MNIEKVLVVDDSKVAHLTLRKMLTERGIGVDWVGSGEDSIAYLRQQKPDVIFMDVMMPGMDGFETAHAITNDTSIGLLPIIMCSANATDDDKRNAENSGAVDFLSKPYTSAELDQILEKVRSTTSAAPTAAAETIDSISEPEELAIDLSEPAAMETEPEAAIDFADLAAFDSLSDDSDKALRDANEPSFELPEPDISELPTMPDATISEDAIIQRAELAAQTAAEQAVREITANMAQEITERARASAEEAAVRKATQAAAQAAKSSTQAVAKEIVRSISEQLTRKVGDLITQRLAAHQKDAAPDMDQLRVELIQAMEDNIGQQVQSALAGDAMQQQLVQLVQEHALPMVEETARNTAHEIAEDFTQQIAETDQSPAALSRANAALFIGLLALVFSGGLIALNFLL